MIDSADDFRKDSARAGKCPVAPSQALTAPDPAAAIRNAASLWAEQNTRPETLDRAEKFRDKVAAVTSFFDYAGKHPGEITPEDVSRWRAEMEARGLKPATVYARVSRVWAFYRWLMSDPQLSAFIRSNPAAQARPRYPHPYQSESTKALSDGEMHSLLAAVRTAGRGRVGGGQEGLRAAPVLLPDGAAAQRGHRPQG